MKNKLKWMILTALISSLCAIGSFIKVPGIVSSAALDSAPAFIGAVFLPPVFAGIAGALGHGATALTAGFPFGPLHIVIAIEMFVIVMVFALMHRRQLHVWKWLFVVVANGILAGVPFIFLISWEFFVAATPSLFVATVINVAVSAAVIPFVSKAVRRERVSRL